MAVKLLFKQGEELKATTTNLSEGGMAIRFEQTLAKVAAGTVQFTLPAPKVSMEPKCEVAWASAWATAASASCRKSPASRLEKWIMKRLESVADPSL